MAWCFYMLEIEIERKRVAGVDKGLPGKLPVLVSRLEVGERC